MQAEPYSALQALLERIEDTLADALACDDLMLDSTRKQLSSAVRFTNVSLAIIGMHRDLGGRDASALNAVTPARDRDLDWVPVCGATYSVLLSAVVYRTAGDLMNASDEELCKVKGLGPKRVAEIRSALEELEQRCRLEAIHAGSSEKDVTLEEIGFVAPPRIDGPTRAAYVRLRRWMRNAIGELIRQPGHPYAWTRAVHAANDAAEDALRDAADERARQPGGLYELALRPATRNALLRECFSTAGEVDEFTAGGLDDLPYVSRMGRRSWQSVRDALDAARAA